MQKKETKGMVIVSVFTAIILLLSYTPIGFIQLGFIKATIIHIPVIIGSVLLGPKKGAILGFVFGVTSFLSNTMTPVISSFVFSPFINLPGTNHGSLWALVICFLPRILTGVIPYYIYQMFKTKNKMIPLTLAGITGSLTNTLLVMGGIFVFFKEDYAAVREVSVDQVYTIIYGIIMTNGIMEAIVAGFLVTVICQALLRNPAIQKINQNP